MPRNPRFDEPGCLHHVMNRGIARRTVFEKRADVRKFLFLLARASRRGWIEVHSYSILSTHFHLLVRSLDGRLSATMRWVLNQYVRYFNRSRRRDGPLMRGRFRSLPVQSRRYLVTLIRYIDQNAVDAGLVARPCDYPYGSARWLREARPRPRWLSRGVVGDVLEEHGPRGVPRVTAYDATFALDLTRSQRNWIERRLSGKAQGFDDLDTLLASSERVRAWALRKARLADGTVPGLAVADPESAMRALDAFACRLAGVTARPRTGRMHAALDLMQVALLRDACGESFVSIARRLSASPSTPKRQYRLHTECMADFQYHDAYAELVSEALRLLHGATIVSRSG